MYLNLKWHVNEIGSTLSPSWRFCHISVYFLMSLPSKGLISLINHVQYVFETCIKHLACWHVPMSRRLASMLFTQWPFWFTRAVWETKDRGCIFTLFGLPPSLSDALFSHPGWHLREDGQRKVVVVSGLFQHGGRFWRWSLLVFLSVVSHSSAFFRIKVHCHFWLWHNSPNKWPRLRAESA